MTNVCPNDSSTLFGTWEVGMYYRLIFYLFLFRCSRTCPLKIQVVPEMLKTLVLRNINDLQQFKTCLRLVHDAIM